MNAHKQANVEDGYNVRKDSHLHQWLDRHQNLQDLISEKSPYEDNYGRARQDASPGNQQSPQHLHKSGLLERNMERRGSLSLAEKKVNQYLATGSIGQNAPNMYRDYHDSVQERRSDSTKLDSNHGEGETPAGCGKKMEQKDGKDRNHRLDVQKSAVRVCGEWSEHISSSGKRYYYNCRTEVSQWEKPKEWHDGSRPPDRSKDAHCNVRSGSSVPVTRGINRTRHTSGNGHCVDRKNRLSSTDSSHTEVEQSPHLKLLDHSRTCADLSGSRVSQCAAALHKDHSSAHIAVSHNHSTHNCHVAESTELKRSCDHLNNSLSAEPACKRRTSSECSASLGPPAAHHTEDVIFHDAEPSPNSTPAQVASSSSAIETLQELQKALTLHIRRQQSKGGGQLNSSTSGTTSDQLQSQLATLQRSILRQQHSRQEEHLVQHRRHQMSGMTVVEDSSAGRMVHHDDCHRSHDGHATGDHKRRDVDDDGGSPVSEMSPRSSCGSPSPSTGSSQLVPAIGTSALSLASLKVQPSATLSGSLSNHYNEKLISHVVGWPGEQLARQDPGASAAETGDREH